MKHKDNKEENDTFANILFIILILLVIGSSILLHNPTKDFPINQTAEIIWIGENGRKALVKDDEKINHLSIRCPLPKDIKLPAQLMIMGSEEKTYLRRCVWNGEY